MMSPGSGEYSMDSFADTPASSGQPRRSPAGARRGAMAAAGSPATAHAVRSSLEDDAVYGGGGDDDDDDDDLYNIGNAGPSVQLPSSSLSSSSRYGTAALRPPTGASAAAAATTSSSTWPSTTKTTSAAGESASGTVGGRAASTGRPASASGVDDVDPDDLLASILDDSLPARRTAPAASAYSSSSAAGQGRAATASGASGSSISGGGAPVNEAASFMSSFGDLQTVGERVLAVAKAKMDVVFDSNRIKPGDPEYMYDKRVEFQPANEASEWDD